MQDNLKFVKSVYDCKFLPMDLGKEVAFVGRSNVGKSSAISALFGKKIARTSKSPGRTQALNFFAFTEHKRIVDFPGYGFAKANKELKVLWQKLITEYFSVRASIVTLIVLMDIRHPMQPKDQDFLSWIVSYNFPILVLLTKADKVSKMQQKQTLQVLIKQLAPYKIECELFSIVIPETIKLVRNKIMQVLKI